MHDEKTLLADSLDGLPRIVKNYLGMIPKEALDLRRNAEAWTIREHLYHIAGLQNMLTERILTIRDEAAPVIKPYQPTPENEAANACTSIDDALGKYAAARRRQVELVRALGEAGLRKKAVHPEYTDYGMLILLNHVLFHEYWHLYRMEEIWLARKFV